MDSFSVAMEGQRRCAIRRIEKTAKLTQEKKKNECSHLIKELVSFNKLNGFFFWVQIYFKVNLCPGIKRESLTG